MIILLEIALVLALVGGIGMLLMRGRNAAERQAVSERRVDAYMLTIRRDAPSPELAAMTDAELRDVLLSGARNLRVEAERRWYAMVLGALVTFMVGIVVATQDGLRGFGIALLVGAVVLYGLNEYLGRRMRAPLEALGLDAERLRVE